MFARTVTVITLMLMGAGGQIALGQGVGGDSPTDTSHVFDAAMTLPGTPPVDWIAAVRGDSSTFFPVELEPAGPAWLAPGMVGSGTRDMINSGQGFELEPFFKLS